MDDQDETPLPERVIPLETATFDDVTMSTHMPDGSTNVAYDGLGDDDDAPCRSADAAVGTAAVVLPAYSSRSPSPPPLPTSNAHGALPRHRKQCAECCLHCVVVVTSLRFLLICVALLGAGSVVAGISLGAMNMTVGSNFLTLSLLFIGLGVIMVIVVGVAWRCVPPGQEPCHKLFNISQVPAESVGDQRFLQLRQHSRSQWHGGILYPEFQYGAPPPAYSGEPPVVLVTGEHAEAELANSDDLGLPSSMPPSYRSHVSAGRRPSILLHIDQSGYLPPPEYPVIDGNIPISEEHASSLAVMSDSCSGGDGAVMPAHQHSDVSLLCKVYCTTNDVLRASQGQQQLEGSGAYDGHQLESLSLPHLPKHHRSHRRCNSAGGGVAEQELA